MTGVFLSVPRYDWCVHLSHPSSCMLVNRVRKTSEKNKSHRNKVLPQNTTRLIQRPCYQRGSPCQVPAGNRTTWRPPDHRKETQTAVVWTCLPFIRSGQKHLARHSERRRKQGRQKMWEDNIREWTGLEFGKSQRAVENRQKWRNWLWNHLWCPNDTRGEGIDDDDDDDELFCVENLRISGPLNVTWWITMLYISFCWQKFWEFDWKHILMQRLYVSWRTYTT